MSNTVALDSLLLKIDPFFKDDSINEIIVNRPGEIWIEKEGQFIVEKNSDITFEYVEMVASLVAAYTNQSINKQKPLLSATLPNGCRVQFVIPPACPSDQIVMCIRQQKFRKISLDEYELTGAFDYQGTKKTDIDKTLQQLHQSGKKKEFIKYAVKNGENIIISGGLSSGKTTLLNSCLDVIPDNERLITIEDAREIFTKHKNVVNLLYSKGGQGHAEVNAQDLIEAGLRLRANRFLFQELRDKAALSFLTAINSGHSGSISTVHANSPMLAYEKIAHYAAQGDTSLSVPELVRYIKMIIPIVIQMDEINGKRMITEIHYGK